MDSMVDISESGLRFKTNAPQEVHIQIQTNGRMVEYDAQLVWAKLNENGKMEYGLKRSSSQNPYSELSNITRKTEITVN